MICFNIHVLSISSLISVVWGGVTIPVPPPSIISCGAGGACFQKDTSECDITGGKESAALLLERYPGVFQSLRNASTGPGSLRCDQAADIDGNKFCTIPFAADPTENYKQCCCQTVHSWMTPQALSAIDGQQYYPVSISSLQMYQCADAGRCGSDVNCNCFDGKCVQVYRWEKFLVSTNPNWPLGQVLWQWFRVPDHCKCNCPLKG